VRNKVLALAVLPLVLAFLGGCGGSSQVTSPPESVPVVVSISATTPTGTEALPAGVNLVSAQATVTGACLLTSSDTNVTTCPSGQSILSSSPTIQFSGLSTPNQVDVLSNSTTDVTAGAYTGIMLTFGSAVMLTVSVDAGQNYTDGTNNCDNTTGTTTIICSFNKVGVPTSTSTYTFSNPITLTAGTPVSIMVGLDLTGSLTAKGTAPATLSFTPIVVVTQGAVGSDGNLVDVNNVTGTVQNIIATTITVIDSATDQPVTLNIGSGTTVTNYNTVTAACATANTLSCPQVGDVVTVAYGTSNTNPIQFNAASINGNPGITSTNGFQGTIVATTPTPEVVVTAVPAGNTLSHIGVGQLYDLNFAAGAVFSNSGGITFTNGTFASPSDLVVGQNVLVDVACPTTGCEFTPPVANPPGQATPGSVTADAMELLPTQISGAVNTLSSPNYTVNGLNSFYTNNGITGFNAQTGSYTTYNGSVTQFSDLTAGNTYYYNGYLLNSGTPGTPDFYNTNIYGAPAPAGGAVKASTR